MNAHEGTPRIGAHTPGPWHANYSSVRAENGNHIAQADDYGKGRDEQCANARLIAAAPELLWALNCVLDELGALTNRSELINRLGETDAARVFAAIARATGAPQP